MAATIQLRRGTAAQWTTANPVLAQGEAGFETDTRKIKVGDGATAWNSLAYHVDPNATPKLQTGDLTLYVRTDGSDTNSGRENTAAGAFRKLSRALEEAAKWYPMGYTTTIQLADGDYTDEYVAISLPAYFGGWRPDYTGIGFGLTIRGNTSDNTAVKIAADVNCGAVLFESVYADYIGSYAPTAYVGALNCNTIQFWANGNTFVEVFGAGTILRRSNAIASGFWTDSNGVVAVSGTVTITGTDLYTQGFAVAARGGRVISSATFSGSYNGSIGRAISNGSLNFSTLPTGWTAPFIYGGTVNGLSGEEWSLLSSELPAASALPSLIRHVSNYGKGLYLKSDGAVWRAAFQQLMDSYGNTISAPLDLNENAVWSLTIPGYLIRNNGTLRLHFSSVVTNNANAKNWRVRSSTSATNIMNFNAASATNHHYWVEIQMRDIATTARCSSFVGATVSGYNDIPLDATQDWTLTIYAQKAVAGDTMSLRQFTLEVLP